MTDEEFYGTAFPALLEAEALLQSLVRRCQLETEDGAKTKLIEKCQSRIKTARSMTAKLNRLNLPVCARSALTEVYDAVGIRIICGFIDDVYRVAQWLSEQPEIEILAVKDYIAYPKPNGYRSCHLQVRIRAECARNVLAEIQIRTMAIDFWATLEHELKYKKEIRDEALIRRELKRCADEIAATDLSMQTIRDIMEGKG
ncbi:MAG: RelA/SpoT domain protein [Eubacteriales bacterium]|nr:RelA/SpoT domain protein [Eubacteriales bacterium]